MEYVAGRDPGEGHPGARAPALARGGRPGHPDLRRAALRPRARRRPPRPEAVEPDGHRADGKIKLTDFGIAKDLDATALTATGRTLGTAAYMAPEQIRGTPAVSHKTDLYALGIVLYQMLTGKPPFEGSIAGRADALPPERAAAAAQRQGATRSPRRSTT